MLQVYQYHAWYLHNHSRLNLYLPVAVRHSNDYIITVVSGWAVFLRPMTGILISNYFLVRKRQLHVGDLYRSDSSSAHWYFAGSNWRAFLAWAMALWLLLPGIVREVRGVSDGSVWEHLCNVSYFFGFFVALLSYWMFSAMSSIARQTGASPFVLNTHGAGMAQDTFLRIRRSAVPAEAVRRVQLFEAWHPGGGMFGLGVGVSKACRFLSP